ncbi:cytochrome b/b6 domain-containing protein [Microbacterium sp. NPDC076768]|uniref:cytochrome b/b6 domain-containing protein n=1 Tax=Microbacterium sp. NPDC076768 TaxID=3154858 RepID=UPI00343789D7
MATRKLRRGLPRVVGGDPWPPADAAALSASDTADTSVAASPTEEPAVSTAAASEPVSAPSAAAAVLPTASRETLNVRRGLPRVPGGDPWPPADAAAPAAATAPAASEPVVVDEASAPAVEAPAAQVQQQAATPTPVAAGSAVRRGLPRSAGGDPWPPAGTTPAVPADVASTDSATPAETAAPVATPVPVAASAVAVPAIADVATPLPSPGTVWNGTAPRNLVVAPKTGRPRPTWTQAIAVLFGAAAVGVLAGAAIAFVRTLLSFPFMQDFLIAFPGEYEPAIAVEPGFSPWVNWAHFFNMFLIVLIIRSGLQVRTEKRPTVFWTPRGNAKGKISLALWFHQALDILWLLNGVIFVVLLFATGHWVRIVPTSWEVFPNALSAALQYLSFDWPHENGWNNYNSLQQLAYFVTVFIAAPLAAITGFRMSGLWPKKAEKLSKAYPVEWARALHFPIMLYFVVFIIAHVALVMLTGFLRNLNHMFAAQDAATWTGFWVFILSLVAIGIGWVAARPLVLAPIAKLFGKVSGR